MKLYNTLTRNIEEIEPLRNDRVAVYTCGPTVYDYPHIGNWFTFIRYDLLIRALRSEGKNVAWVMNITDVGHLVSDADEGEDKLEKGAKREGKTAWDIAAFYADYFTKGLERLNITTPTKLPKATDHIQEQIDLIKTLEQKGFTYKIDDGIYFDTSKFEGYAAFARLDLDEQHAGARIAVNSQKRQQTDFALWKFSPSGQKRDMEWDSPWGKGFPGWHLECSAMSMKYLGQTIDIHSGGIDHIPVHHTNEIAQSESATGKRYANYWMHTNHILVNNDKISKSLGNGITLEDIENRGYSLEALRLLVLQSHYRSQSKFSWDELEAANNRLKAYQAFADLRWQPIPESAQSADVSSTDYEQYLHDIFNELANDLNTPKALATLSQIADAHAEGIPAVEHESFEAFLDAIDHMLGLQLLLTPNINDEQKKLLLERQQARRTKDWATSDALRDKLLQQGIGLRDTSHGPVWYRI